MFSRDVLRKCFAVILPVFVLFGSFHVVKISSQINVEAACNGRVADEGQETPPVQEYCPGNDGVNYTSEYAYFFTGSLPDRDEPIQKWYRSQYWGYDDDVYCYVDVVETSPERVGVDIGQVRNQSHASGTLTLKNG